jgi:acyl carrier protein
MGGTNFRFILRTELESPTGAERYRSADTHPARIGEAMNTKQELLTRLQQISSGQLGIEQEKISEESTWIELGADSLDRLAMSRAIEDEFQVEIPHEMGERLNTIGQTVDHLLTRLSLRKETSNIRIEMATTNQQWAEILGIRTQVFTIECELSFKHLPGPGEPGVWHFLARDKQDPVGTLSVVDTTTDRHLHQRYRLNFGKNARVARYTQLAILKPYRRRGIFKMLVERAQKTVISQQGFTFGWLLYPASQGQSPMLTESLGFTAKAPFLKTEFGHCHVLVRQEPTLPQLHWSEDSSIFIDTCPI